MPSPPGQAIWLIWPLGGDERTQPKVRRGRQHLPVRYIHAYAWRLDCSTAPGLLLLRAPAVHSAELQANQSASYDGAILPPPTAGLSAMGIVIVTVDKKTGGLERLSLLSLLCGPNPTAGHGLSGLLKNSLGESEACSHEQASHCCLHSRWYCVASPAAVPTSSLCMACIAYSIPV